MNCGVFRLMIDISDAKGRKSTKPLSAREELRVSETKPQSLCLSHFHQHSAEPPFPSYLAIVRLLPAHCFHPKSSPKHPFSIITAPPHGSHVSKLVL
jgi:hypothetical protein